MNHNQKRFVKNSIVIPLIIAVAAAGVFFAVLNIFSDEFPFKSKIIYASDFESSEVLRTDKLTVSGDTVSKSVITPPTDNMLVGSIDINGESLELIYNANAVNAVGRCNIMPDSKLIGEIGSVFAQCYKADADFINQLNEGDSVKVNTYYGDFVYEVTKIQVCDSAFEAEKLGDGISRAFVLCTDGDKRVGISDKVFTVVCRMTDGTKVTE